MNSLSTCEGPIESFFNFILKSTGRTVKYLVQRHISLIFSLFYALLSMYNYKFFIDEESFPFWQFVVLRWKGHLKETRVRLNLINQKSIVPIPMSSIILSFGSEFLPKATKNSVTIILIKIQTTLFIHLYFWIRKIWSPVEKKLFLKDSEDFFIHCTGLLICLVVG